MTEFRDLRGGRPCWVAERSTIAEADGPPAVETDVAIVGAGIMGATIAERLSRLGLGVQLLDRRPPAHGSTAASTALVLWAADLPLTHLARDLGESEAGRRWRRVHSAVRALADRIDREGIECGRAERPELYLAGSLLDDDALIAEGDARRRAGLPSIFLNAAEVARRFGVAPRPALLSSGSYEIDPVRLTLALLERARAQGARLSFPVDVVRLEKRREGSILHCADGRTIVARKTILASGSERPTLFLPAAFDVVSSYAIATRPRTAPLWRENALIWEASSPYLYARATADGRIIAGGGDENFEDAHRRDALIEAKSGILAARLAEMVGQDDVEIDCAWAATFGSSPDGLPAIGRVRDRPDVWIASGFGGNGVTFAELATELIAADLSGAPDPDAACFDFYRFSAEATSQL